ncbi:MAG: phosphopantetheine-binding protein [Polyangiaceae bacterium]
MEQLLRTIIAKIVETTPDFEGEADLRDDLDLDSHRAVELVFEIERAFDVQVPNDCFGEMRTLNKTLRLVERLKGAAAA